MTLTANSSNVSVATAGSGPDLDPDSEPTADPDRTGGPAHQGVATITAVLVAHDGAAWLPRALAAVAEQTRLPDRVLAVDTGSADETPGLLRRSLGAEQVRTVARTTGFGAAVRSGLEGLAPLGGTEWLWLLHDDCAPEPDALARLLDVVRRSPSIGVAGPKLVAWDDRDQLLEVGLTTSRGGRRLTDIEPGERDQGQQDHRHDVLAVGTAGLLVRRDVWDRLGGLDPAFPLFRDDIDFGWRAQLAGHRVVVVPGARVADAQASARGLRAVDAVRGPARRVDRTHGLQVAMAGAPAVALPFLLLWFAGGGLLRAAGLLVAKAPRRAYDELLSVGAAVLTPWRVVASRWRARGTREVPRRDIAQLLAPRRSAFRGLAEAFSGSLGRDQVEVVGGVGGVGGVAGTAAQLESGPTSEESENAERVTTRLTSRVLTNPGLLVVLLTSAVTGAVVRPLLGRGTLTGGQLLSYSGSARQVWHSYVDAWHGTGLGTDAPPAPYRAVLAGLAWLLQPLTTQPSALAVDVLLIGAMPLSALTAYVAAGTVLRNPWVRAWAALTWATLPTVTGAVESGRLAGTVVHVLLPLVVLGFARTLRRPGSSTAAFAGGLALAVAASFAPVLLLPAAAAALVGLVLGGWARRARALLLVAVPAVLLAPWLGTLWDDPRQLFTGPGLLVPSGAGHPLDLALLHPGGPGVGSAWLAAPLLLVGVAGLFRRGGSALLASAGLLALAGLGLALVLPRVVIATGTSSSAGAGLVGPLGAWSGTGVDLLAVAVLVAALHGVDGLGARLSRHRFGWRQLILAPLAAAALVTTLVTAALLVVSPTAGPVQRSAAMVLPAVAVDQATGPNAARTLVLMAAGPPAAARRRGTRGRRAHPFGRGVPPGRGGARRPGAHPAAARGPASGGLRDADPRGCQQRRELEHRGPSPPAAGDRVRRRDPAGAGRLRAAAGHDLRPDPVGRERVVRAVAGRGGGSGRHPRGRNAAAAGGAGAAGGRDRPAPAGRPGRRTARAGRHDGRCRAGGPAGGPGRAVQPCVAGECRRRRPEPVVVRRPAGLPAPDVRRPAARGRDRRPPPPVDGPGARPRRGAPARPPVRPPPP